ncbi:hypothetical protein Mapa_000902 [Marchantia paleacea]|nr:hypothetical protein Mapa_000902 [Marchantia paleacea]
MNGRWCDYSVVAETAWWTLDSSIRPSTLSASIQCLSSMLSSWSGTCVKARHVMGPSTIL